MALIQMTALSSQLYNSTKTSLGTVQRISSLWFVHANRIHRQSVWYREREEREMLYYRRCQLLRFYGIGRSLIVLRSRTKKVHGEKPGTLCCPTTLVNAVTTLPPPVFFIFHSYCCMYRAQVLILFCIDPDTQSLYELGSAENMFLTSWLQRFRFTCFM